MVKVAEFTGHTSRVLHMAQSPDGTTVVSAAADETLRFWRVFAEASVAQKVDFHSTLALPITPIASQDWAKQMPIVFAKLPMLPCWSNSALVCLQQGDFDNTAMMSAEQCYVMQAKPSSTGNSMLRSINIR